MPPPPPPVLSLPDELIEEVFFRLPPDEPEHLARASLACKLWLGLLTGPTFRRRYRDFHGAPPMMGFLYSWRLFSRQRSEDPLVPQFLPTTKFGARIPDDGWGDSKCAVLDCRHGRVLLGDYDEHMPLLVWDPMTGCRTKLESPQRYNMPSTTELGGAAVLCAVTGCDHRACHQGPFRVVFFGMSTHDGDHCTIHVSVSSPETGEWSEPCPGLDLGIDSFMVPVPPVVIQDALYFIHNIPNLRVGILKYDMGSNCLSQIDAPRAWAVSDDATILMAMKDDSLGFAQVNRLTLYLWSRKMGFDGLASWTKHRVINLKNLLPIQNPDKRLRLVGSVEGRDIVFVTTELGIYEIDLKSLQWKKLWKREKFLRLIPYMSFHNPHVLDFWLCNIYGTYRLAVATAMQFRIQENDI
ncbi:uncharacterized protein [Aegilops tauschii subsp. strangulata]|uniref:uncharacterized protein n=1 Tax=Aegilops tauschii subsp. strangulata TaxID=200361 RepID=UPI00098A4B7B|nr:uncharacterized protein LOC109739731 [Aegilops tauschii subsp. strangulata]